MHPTLSALTRGHRLSIVKVLLLLLLLHPSVSASSGYASRNVVVLLHTRELRHVPERHTHTHAHTLTPVVVGCQSAIAQSAPRRNHRSPLSARCGFKNSCNAKTGPAPGPTTSDL
uniref:Putative secreted protein n=1 Tax=Anopheles darlingi TaxID=43151 RepID=A0A2M4DIE5_ANODA